MSIRRRFKVLCTKCYEYDILIENGQLDFDSLDAAKEHIEKSQKTGAQKIVVDYGAMRGDGQFPEYGRIVYFE